MKKERKNKGITLIALIITIIVMLILVGVSVNVALNGGLFDTAKTAASETQLATDEEVLLSAKISLLYGEDKAISKDGLVENLPTGWEVSETEGIYTVTSSKGNEFTVYEDGDIIEGTLNKYGFFYNKEYACYDYLNYSFDQRVSIMVSEDESITISAFLEADLNEGDPIQFPDLFDTNVVLTVEAIEFNKEYTGTGVYNSECTYIVDEDGNIKANFSYSADNTIFAEGALAFVIGGERTFNISEDGKSFDTYYEKIDSSSGKDYYFNLEE